MTGAQFDVIVVGSGPSGVSAAFPLAEAGLSVLLVDGGREASFMPPSQPYLLSRFNDKQQWRWMVGSDFYALQNVGAVSPKLRVPGNAYVFDGFLQGNRIEPKDFVALGSLSKGGLSNAWGCGVSKLSHEELRAFPFGPDEIEASYAAVARRTGVSGATDDDLSAYFGLDAWASPPVVIDDLQGKILRRYGARRGNFSPSAFRLGRSRVAVLTEDRGARKACDRSGNCLWGCHRRSLYSAVEDLEQLMQYPNFEYRPGRLVTEVGIAGEHRFVVTTSPAGSERVVARRVVLAAGTLATTALVMRALKLPSLRGMQACPSAAFMLWVPEELGRGHTASFGLGQLSFALQLASGIDCFGSLFSTTGVPYAEFIRYMPFRKRYGADFLKAFLSSCVAGNVFLPGSLTNTTLLLTAGGQLMVKGRFDERVPALLGEAKRRLRRSFLNLGAVLLPMSFRAGKPGGDIHYAASLPMRAAPQPGETNRVGEPVGLKGIHVVDGACLSELSAKSHTLTLMANADRIARHIAKELR